MNTLPVGSTTWPERATIHSLSRLDAVVVALVLGLLTLHDFYWGPFARGLRPFDFVAIGLLAVLVTLETLEHPVTRLRLAFAAPASLMAISTLLFIGVAAAVLSDPAANIKVAVGVLVGLALFVLFNGLVLPAPWLARLLKALIIIHAVALAAQALVFYTSGAVLNYHEFFGAEPRVIGRFFRPSGLFLEPAQYGFFMTLMLSLKLRLHPVPDAVVWIGFGSVLLTVSLYGVLAVSTLLVLYLWRSKALWSILALVVLVVSAKPQLLEQVQGVVFIAGRISDLGGDVSAQERYSGLANLAQSPLSTLDLLFGRGISNNYERYGASGIAFLINGIGLAGMLLFVMLYAAIVAPGTRVREILVLILALAAASRWTGWLWWVWLGLYANRFPPIVLCRDTFGVRWVVRAGGGHPTTGGGDYA